MTVGYGMIHESFTTGVHLDRAAPHHPGRISRRAVHFSREPLALQPDGEGACEIDFYIAYSFRSRLFERLVGGLFAKAVEKYTSAFEARADAVYRTECAGARLTAMREAAKARARRFAA